MNDQTTAGVDRPSRDEMDRRFLHEITCELKRARAKFPENRHTLAALFEEVGELANALIEHTHGTGATLDIYKEAVQVAAMAIRIAVDGDDSFLYDPADTHDALPSTAIPTPTDKLFEEVAMKLPEPWRIVVVIMPKEASVELRGPVYCPRTRWHWPPPPEEAIRTCLDAVLELQEKQP